MRRLLASGLALALAAVVVTALAGTPAAQTGARVLEACEPERQEIRAAGLPGAVGPRECPVEGRPIVDGMVESVVPLPAGAFTPRC